MEPVKRRNVLAGLAATPALIALHATNASALAPAAGSGGPPPDGGGTRYFPWPTVEPGSTVDWPAGAVALEADGATRRDITGLATVPARGAQSQHVYLTGYSVGAYTVSTPGRRPTRVTFDAGAYPFLRVWGEYGGRDHAPYWGMFYGLIITPVARPTRTAVAA